MLTSFHRSHSSSRPFGAARGRGFTLIELLVVVAIITILTAVLLLQQKKFDSSTLLRSLAYSVALTVRQAQIYGTSVRQFNSGFNYNYGVYFSSGDSNHYYLFADVDNDGVYDDPGEKVQQFTVGSGYSISDFCGIISSISKNCNVTYLTIYFKRPNPDAQFVSNASGENYCGAYIQLTGPGNETRTVKVSATGQIQIRPINETVSGC